VLNCIRVQELEIPLDELVHLLHQNNYNRAGDTHIIHIQASVETTSGIAKLTDRLALFASATEQLETNHHPSLQNTLQEISTIKTLSFQIGSKP
jgi:hypothetical protein